jgi:hypothetical protein
MLTNLQSALELRKLSWGICQLKLKPARRR